MEPSSSSSSYPKSSLDGSGCENVKCCPGILGFKDRIYLEVSNPDCLDRFAEVLRFKLLIALEEEERCGFHFFSFLLAEGGG